MSALRLLVLGLLLAGCVTNQAQPPQVIPESVAYWHDDAHHVSCWLYGRGGGGFTAAISCLPDLQVHR